MDDDTQPDTHPAGTQAQTGQTQGDCTQQCKNGEQIKMKLYHIITYEDEYGTITIHCYLQWAASIEDVCKNYSNVADIQEVDKFDDYQHVGSVFESYDYEN